MSDFSPLEQAHEYSRLASDALEIGDFTTALEWFEMALQLLEEYGPPASIAWCQMSRATCFRYMGRYQEALAEYDAALNVLGGQGLPMDIARCRMNRAICLRELGRYWEALAGYDAISPLLGAHGLPVEVALCSMNRASCLIDLGRYEEALVGFDTALPLLREHGMPVDIARCEMNRAICLRALGWYEEALTGHDLALPLLEKYGLPVEIANCQMNRASCLRDLGRYEEALAGYDVVFPLYEEHGLPGDIARCRMNIANCLRNLGRCEEAIPGYDVALGYFKEHGLPADIAACQVNRAACLIEVGRYEEALAGYDTATPLLEHYGPVEDIARVEMSRAMILDGLARYEDAWVGYLRSLDLVETATSRLQDIEHLILSRADYGDLYRSATSLALQHISNAEAFAVVQRAKGRTLVDALADKELFRFDRLERETAALHDAHVISSGEFRERIGEISALRNLYLRSVLGKNSAQPNGYDQIVAALLPGEVLVDIFGLNERGQFVFMLARPGTSELDAVLIVGDMRLVTLIERWHENRAAFDAANTWLLDNPGADPLFIAEQIREKELALSTADKLLIALGEVLLPGLLQHICAGETLVFSPEGALHGIPLAALVIPGTNQRLIERFGMQRIPTATWLALIREREDDDSLPLRYIGVAPFAGPAVDEAQMIANLQGDLVRDDRSQPDLPGTHLEMIILNQLFEGGQGLVNQQATRAAVTSNLANRRIVHFATHGAKLREGESLMQYRILLAGGEDIQVREIYERQVPFSGVDLVCLSACHLGDVVQKGSMAIGFTQAFLQGGARVVMAPLWAVDDMATYRLMRDWYSQLADGTSVVDAWRNVACDAIAAGEHPYRWAGFCPNGDGSMVFSTSQMSS